MHIFGLHVLTAIVMDSQNAMETDWMEVKIVDGSNSFLKPKPNQCLETETEINYKTLTLVLAEYTEMFWLWSLPI